MYKLNLWIVTIISTLALICGCFCHGFINNEPLPTAMDVADAQARCIRTCAIQKFKLIDTSRKGLLVKPPSIRGSSDGQHEELPKFGCLADELPGYWACEVVERIAPLYRGLVLIPDGNSGCINRHRLIQVSTHDCSCEWTSFGACPSIIDVMHDLMQVKGIVL